MYFLIFTRVLNDPISQTHTSRLPRNQADSWFFFSQNQTKKLGWVGTGGRNKQFSSHISLP